MDNPEPEVAREIRQRGAKERPADDPWVSTHSCKTPNALTPLKGVRALSVFELLDHPAISGEEVCGMVPQARGPSRGSGSAEDA